MASLSVDIGAEGDQQTNYGLVARQRGRRECVAVEATLSIDIGAEVS